MLRNLDACSFALKSTLLISLPVWAVQMLAPYGMNNAGQIVGKGLYDGVEQAFLLARLFRVSRPAPLKTAQESQQGLPIAGRQPIVLPPRLFAL